MKNETNARRAYFELRMILGRLCFFTREKINKDLFKDYYVYDIRHSDEDFGEPATIEKNVFVNRYGTIITNEPIEELEKNDGNLHHHYVLLNNENDVQQISTDVDMYEALLSYDAHPSSDDNK